MRTKIFAAVLIFPLALVGCSDKPKDEKKDAAGDPKKPAAVESGSVTLNSDNTKIGFVGTKPDGKHEGGFNEFSGTIAVDKESNAISTISVEIQTESLWADDDKLANHLKSADFFNVKEHPTASFESTKIETKDATTGEHTITGNLSLLEATKEIRFPATAMQKDGKLALNSEFTIDRTDFGMDYGQGKVDNEVTIRIAVGASDKAADE